MRTFPSYANCFWGSTQNKGAVNELNRNHMVIVAEGVTLDQGIMPSAPVMAVSTNARSVWKHPGSVYYKSQQEFLKVCDDNDYWLRWDDGVIAEGWPNTLMFDISHPSMPKAFLDNMTAHILSKPEFTNVQTIFYDECHAHLIGLVTPRAGHKLMMFNGGTERVVLGANAEYNAAWANGTRKLLRATKVAHPSKAVMPNGTFIEAHPAIGGHFFQGCNGSNQLAIFNQVWNADVANYDTQTKNIVIHSIQSLPANGWKAFEKLCFYNACFASLLDAHSQVEDNTFRWPINYQAIPQGSFGVPLDYKHGSEMPIVTDVLPGLKKRLFEHADVIVNLNDVPVVFEGKVYNPRSARVFWK